MTDPIQPPTAPQGSDRERAHALATLGNKFQRAEQRARIATALAEARAAHYQRAELAEEQLSKVTAERDEARDAERDEATN